MTRASEIRGLLSDVHGVLFTHPEAIPGSVNAVRRLRNSGFPVRFLTNSTQFPKSHILETLVECGFDLTSDLLLTAPEAAGEIHTDFQKGFIRAETMSYDDYIAGNGEQGAREAGRLRSEGKDYVMAEGDVVHFLFNV